MSGRHGKAFGGAVTRQEAIQFVIDTAFGVHTEFCVGKDKCKEECRQALIVLGASQTELDSAEWFGSW